MKINLSTSKYNIVDTGTVFLFEEDGELIFNIDTENQFKFKIILRFINEDNSDQIINKTVTNDTITMECVNFLSSGTGTSVPLELATIQKKKMYIMFWTYLEGNVLGQKKSRSVKYTFFLER